MATAVSRAWASLPTFGRRDRSGSPTRSFTNEAIPEDDILVGGNIPHFMGQELPNESGILEERLKRPPQLQIQRAPFQDKLTFFMLVVLGTPLISCAWMSRHPSVIYWIGQSGTLIPVGVVLWVLIGNDLLTRKVVQRRLAVIAVLVLPITALLVTAHVHKLDAVDIHTRLQSQDCTSFPGKVLLEQAWQDAFSVYKRCVHVKRNQTGAPLKELQQVTSVQRCAGYEDGRDKWGKEWDYLEDLERTQRCAGWCTVEVPLWHNMVDYKPHDRCSWVVAEMMGGQVYRTARQIVFYCFFALLFLGILFSLIEL
mmetsp:Transcript_14932/g.42925  ORF Transcript_14932/g.42925 Transcript_14932/m.42925 type:complete len:311 (-) Transcript_14932:79-1011(-)